MLGQQRSPSPSAGCSAPGLRSRSARTCVLQQARNHRSAAGADSSSSDESASLWDATSSGSDEDSDAQSWASEEEAEAGPHPSLRQQQHPARRCRGQPANAPAADPPAAAAAAAEPPAGMKLHQPYSHLLLCEAQFVKRNLCLARHLCTDLADLHSQGSCAVQVSVEVHPSGWDASEDCRAYVMQQQWPSSQQQHSAPPALPAASSQTHGPFAAALKCGSGRMRVTALSHDNNVARCFKETTPHTVVLQERVPGASCPPHFRLHIQPGNAANPRNAYGKAISRAGQGKGLQVLPGSVTEVTEAGAALCDGRGRIRILIPSVLACSQLPSAVILPASVSVTAAEQQAAAGTPDCQLGHWEEGCKLYRNTCEGLVELKWPPGDQPLAAYVGRRIARLSLLPHQDSYRLTVTFAPPSALAPAPAAAAAAAGASPTAAQVMPAAATAASSGLDTTPAGQSAGHRAPAAPAAPTPAPPTTAALQEARAANGTGQQPPSAQAGNTAAAGHGVGGGRRVSAQECAPAAAAAAAGGLLSGGAGSAQALLLPRKRPAAEPQQPAAAAAAAGHKSGSGAGAATDAASNKKPRGSRLAVQQIVPPPAAHSPGLGQIPAAAAAAAAAAGPLAAHLLRPAGLLGPSVPGAHLAAATGAGVLLIKQEPLADDHRLPGPLSPGQPVLLPREQPAVQTLVQNAAGGGGSSAGPTAAAALGPGPVCIKQEPPAAADVMDLTADSDGDGEEQQQQQQASALPAAATVAAPLAGLAAGGPTNPAVPAAAGPDTAQVGAAAWQAALAVRGLLPAGLQLLPASSAAAMEQQLAALMAAGLRPLLPRERYSRLAKQLGEVFGRHMRGEGVDYMQLQTMYVFVQAAVDGGQVGEVVSTLEDRLSRLA